MWPVIIGGALAAGSAAGNYLSGLENAELMEDAYNKISGMADRAVASNEGDIANYRNLLASTYGAGNAAYGDALAKFLNSPVYQNEGFSYGKGVEEFLDPAFNQRVDAAMSQLNREAANNGGYFSSDFVARQGARQQALASEEWQKAYDRLMQDRSQAMQEYNANSQNAWNNFNAQQSRLGAAVDAYGNDRAQYVQGMGDATLASMNNRLGGLNTQAQTTMGVAQANQGTSPWNLLGGLSNAGASFMGSYFGGR